MGDGEGLSLLPYHTKPAAGAAILIGKSPDSRFNPSPFLLNFPHAKATQEKDEALHLEPQLSRSSPQDLSERGGGGQWDSGHAQHTQRCHDKGWHHQGPSSTDPSGQWCGLEQPWYRCGRAGSQLRRTAISKPKLTYVLASGAVPSIRPQPPIGLTGCAKAAFVPSCVPFLS